MVIVLRLNRIKTMQLENCMTVAEMKRKLGAARDDLKVIVMWNPSDKLDPVGHPTAYADRDNGEGVFILVLQSIL